MSRDSFSLLCFIICVYVTKLFISLFERAFKMMKNGRLFYGDSTRGCRVIQGFDLCKLDDL